MALWLVRAGKYGEHEQKFLQEGRIYLTWQDLDVYDFSKTDSFDEIKKFIKQAYPDSNERQLGNYTGQVYAFCVSMKKGDWVVMPLKNKSAIAIGEITSDLNYLEQAPPLYRYWRTIQWLTQEVPRSAFSQDLLYSFGAVQSICQIQRNNAEKRIRKMAQSNWTPELPPTITSKPIATDADAVEEPIDLEQLGRDAIAKLIIRKFKGHGMERLVEAILKAQGYTTYHSPEGADKGIDILAAPGALGFGHPRICVQVKSHDVQVDRPTLDQLIGAMQNVHADQGLLVSWSGFKSSVSKEVANQFFRVRLWDQDALIDALLEYYDKIDEDLRAELPLKRIWTVATQEAGE